MVKTLVELRGVSKAFGRRRVLEHVDLAIAEGARVIVAGENGTGKSTLLAIAAKVIEADEGHVEVSSKVGFAPESPDLPDHLSAEEWIDLVASLMRAPSGLRFGVEAFRHKRIGALSLGQRQRVSLAGAWLGDRSLLILDEPTNGLDRDAREEVIARLAGRTALIATHDRDFAMRVGTETIQLR